LDAARVTYQRFFTRYRRLAGLSAKAREASRELWTVCGLSVACLPTHRRLRRRSLRTTIVPAGQKWTAIAVSTARRHATGQPVLVAIRKLAASVEASAALAKAGLQHRLLNAAQDHVEAEIISHAGEMGQIMIATNMAGRRADIPLGLASRSLGGCRRSYRNCMRCGVSIASFWAAARPMASLAAFSWCWATPMLWR
jgi:preprotein translocase subunit SecA